MSKMEFNVAVVGASGAVGREMVKILEERKFPVERIRLLASEKSLGRNITFNNKEMPIDVLAMDSFEGIDIALFSTGADVSRRFAPVAAEAGAVVIDNTSAFRMDPDVPLVVPEVNPDALAEFSNRRIISNPNCSTIELVVVLAPLLRTVPIVRVVVATYQAVSGAGTEAIEELSSQSVALFSQRKCNVSIFPHRIAFNCIPHIDSFLDDGTTKEEEKMMNETKKILKAPSIAVAVTAVRVPVFYGHSEAVFIEFGGDIDPDRAREILKQAAGVEVIDDPKLNRYPMALDAAGQDAVFVGRIRRDLSVKHGLAMWIVADNVRKGAALNAVQIAEIMIEKYL